MQSVQSFPPKIQLNFSSYKFNLTRKKRSWKNITLRLLATHKLASLEDKATLYPQKVHIWIDLESQSCEFFREKRLCKNL